MDLVLSIIFLIIGFVLLILGGNWLVSGASSLAKRLSISEIVIGLTIVAFGTSAPELIVNIFSSAEGVNDIVFGNILGSNIFNILVILGISGLICPIEIQKNTIWKEIPFSLFVVLLLFILVNDNLIDGSSITCGKDILSRIDGIILLVFFVVFVVYIFAISKIQVPTSSEIRIRTPFVTMLYILGGLVGLFFGGKWVVDSSVKIAKSIGISEKFIAITIVSGGTSLPELVTSVIAAIKKNYDISIGNIIGSNVFNIFFVLGISSVISNANYDIVLNIDMGVLVFATLILFFSMFTGRTKRVDRWEAAIFIITYIGYLVYLFVRK